MQFSVGDRVVHPKHGAGLVRGLAHMGLAQEPKQYYVIEIPSQGLILYVPQREADGGAIRPVASESGLRLALEMLRGIPRPLPDDPVERQDSILAKLATGRPLFIAEVLRDLAGRGCGGRLTVMDRRLQSQAVTLLAAEVSLVLGGDPTEVAEMIEASLREDSTPSAPGPDAGAEV